jgi:ribosomal-protein-alanine N-acetyltransferase
LEVDQLLNVRRVQARDLSAINDIANAVLRESYSMELFTHLFERSSGSFFVAEERARIYGFALAVPLSPKSLRLLMLAVRADMQSRGIGKMLLDTCKEHARSRMMTDMVLEVGVDNDRAIAFYGRNGFKMISTIQEYYNDRSSAYVMKCFLPMS